MRSCLEGILRGDMQAVVLGENVSDAVTDPRVGQLTRHKCSTDFFSLHKTVDCRPRRKVFDRKLMRMPMRNFYLNAFKYWVV